MKLTFDAYTLKWIAIIGMITNHMVFAWLEFIPFWLRFPLYMAGGVTYPIMAYFVVEGYRHTSNMKKYILRLFIFGLIAQPFHVLTFRMFTFNILFTIILALFILMLYDRMKIRFLFWLVFIIASIVAMAFDWFFVGILIPLMYHIISDEKRRRTWPAIVSGILWFGISMFAIWGFTIMQATPGAEAQLEEFIRTYGDMDFLLPQATFFIGCFFAVFLLRRYNGERGKRMKWLFYASYPLHLAVLGLVALALGLVDLDSISFMF